MIQLFLFCFENVFVDYVNQLQLDRMTKKEALVQAGLTRIHPIMMTALATILGGE